MGVAVILGFGVTVAVGFGLHLLTNAIPKLSKLAAVRAAQRLPQAMRCDHEKAWLADLAVLETDFERLRCVAGCWIASLRTRRPFSKFASRQRVLAKRRHLRIIGTIALWSAGQVREWPDLDSSSQLSRRQRLIIGLLLASKEQLKPAMKEYILSIEADLAQNPRQFESREEFTREILIPIAREMKLFTHFHGQESSDK